MSLDRTLPHYRRALTSLAAFARAGGIKLRPYQLAAGEAIVDSVRGGQGLSFAVIFPRQSGKDELMAQLKAYLMACCAWAEAGIVEVNPTYRPQTINAILRLETRLTMNFVTQPLWGKRSDFMRSVGFCRTSFLSGDGQASVVGATASLLLIVNEAQDIEAAVYDKKFEPMRASTNATAVFCGTVWTSSSLLARETRLARQLEGQDGVRRVFLYTAEEVGRLNKAYARFVEAVVRKHGRNHPFIRTQYFCEEIDAQAGMFTAARLALMQGDEPPQSSPPIFEENGGTPVPEAQQSGSRRGVGVGRPYAFLLDVAGQDEFNMSSPSLNPQDVVPSKARDLGIAQHPGAQRREAGVGSPLTNPGRDSVSLTIASLDLSTLETLQAPTYRFVDRQQWTGENHLVVFGKLKSLVESWKPQYIVMDASGVGEGLWAMLDKAFPSRVIPVKFSQQVKSELGWRYIAIIETGRVRDLCPTDQVRAQYAACQSEILPGPAKTLRWGVPEGRRGADGELIHDDYLLADALIAEIDRLQWAASTTLVSSEGFDPLEGIPFSGE